MIAALVQGATRAEAAAKAGVAERSVYRRLKSLTFAFELESAHLEQVAIIKAGLAQAATSAAKTLQDLQSDDVPERVRLEAAKAAIELYRMIDIKESNARRELGYKVPVPVG
jgi:hypothetical protein